MGAQRVHGERVAHAANCGRWAQRPAQRTNALCKIKPTDGRAHIRNATAGCVLIRTVGKRRKPGRQRYLFQHLELGAVVPSSARSAVGARRREHKGLRATFYAGRGSAAPFNGHLPSKLRYGRRHTDGVHDYQTN